MGSNGFVVGTWEVIFSELGHGSSKTEHPKLFTHLINLMSCSCDGFGYHIGPIPYDTQILFAAHRRPLYPTVALDSCGDFRIDYDIRDNSFRQNLMFAGEFTRSDSNILHS